MLKSDGGLCLAIQQLAALFAAALRVMHPNLYWSSLRTVLGLGLCAVDNQLQETIDCLRDWASVFTALAVMCNRCSPLHHDPLSQLQWFDGMTSVGNYGMGRMRMPNIGIEIVYDSSVMAAVSGRIVRHGMDEVDGDRITWIWYMQDDVHEFVGMPRADYVRYEYVLTDTMRC